MRVLVDSWASMIQAYLVLRESFFYATGFSVLSAKLARHDGFQWHFQLLSRIFHGVLEFHVIRIDITDSSQCRASANQ